MTKKKGSKDPWVKSINGVFARPRAKRGYNIPKDYILSIADQRWRTQPSREIIYNTLAEMYSVSYEKGYLRKGDDIRFFKDKQEKHFEQDWGSFRDSIDDLIHERSNNQQPK